MLLCPVLRIFVTGIEQRSREKIVLTALETITIGHHASMPLVYGQGFLQVSASVLGCIDVDVRSHFQPRDIASFLTPILTPIVRKQGANRRFLVILFVLYGFGCNHLIKGDTRYTGSSPVDRTAAKESLFGNGSFFVPLRLPAFSHRLSLT